MYLLQLVDANRGECLWIKKCKEDDIDTLRAWGALPDASSRYVKKIKIPPIFAVTDNNGTLYIIGGIPEVYKAFGSSIQTTCRYLGWLVSGKQSEVTLPYPAGRLFVRLASAAEMEQYLIDHPLHNEQ